MKKFNVSRFFVTVFIGLSLASCDDPASKNPPPTTQKDTGGSISFSYCSASLSLKVGTAMNPCAVTVSSGQATAFSISPALPAGLVFDIKSGTISGTPTTVLASSSSTVVANGPNQVGTQALSILIASDIVSTITYGSSNVNFTVGTAISSLKPTIKGSAVTQFSISPALPAGLSLNTSTGIISGTPTVVADRKDYLVSAPHATGFTIRLAVNDLPPNNLKYTYASLFYSIGLAIPANSPSAGGGKVTTYSVSPTLPQGLTLSANGVISGTPMIASAATDYTVTALNSGGATTTHLDIGVGSAEIDNLRDRSTVHTGAVVVKTYGGGSGKVGMQLDGGSIQSAEASANVKFILPHGTPGWKMGSKHTIKAGALINGAFVVPKLINVIVGNNQDINGDGYADLAVTTTTSNGNVINIYLSTAANPAQGLAAVPAATIGPLSGPAQFAAVALGDFNGDGYADLAVGATSPTGETNQLCLFYSGGVSGISAASGAIYLSSFGIGITSMVTGDFDGDGFADLAVGSAGDAGDPGRVSIYYAAGAKGINGSRSGKLVDPVSRFYDQFGRDVVVGDFNGDGYSDLAISSNYSVYVFNSQGSAGFSATPNAALKLTGSLVFGTAIATGDFNGDGFSDLAVSAPAPLASTGTGPGQVFVFTSAGNAGITSARSSSITDPNPTLNGTNVNAFGATLAAGDLNRDGFSDLVVINQVLAANTKSRLYAYSSQGASGLRTAPSQSIVAVPTGSGNSLSLGYALAIGDYRGAGLTELMVASKEVAPFNGPVGGSVDAFRSVNATTLIEPLPSASLRDSLNVATSLYVTGLTR